MAAFPRTYRSSATHRNGGTAGHRRAAPSQTAGRTYSDVGTGIHNAKVEGIKEGGELPRLCNFIAESAIRFLSKLSCRWRRGYRAAHHPLPQRLLSGSMTKREAHHFLSEASVSRFRTKKTRKPRLFCIAGKCDKEISTGLSKDDSTQQPTQRPSLFDSPNHE